MSNAPVSGTTETAPGDRLERQFEHAAAVLRGASRVTIVCHENPDADTLGGGLALARVLDALGVETEVVCGTRWPATMAFLPGIDRIRPEPEQVPDAIAVIDCASVDRAGATVARWVHERDAPVVNVDHHVSNAAYGTVSCLDHRAAATSEIVARLIRVLSASVDRDVATLLVAGILHDTDGLRAQGTTPATLRLVADLVEAGADIAAVSSQLFGRRPLSALRLWGAVLESLEAHHEGRVVVGVLSERALRSAAAHLLDAEDLPDLIATARGADVSLLLRELGPSEIRVSIRTSQAVDAAALAGEFGGGGHERAAGCTLVATIDEARRELLEACRVRLGGAAEEVG